MKKVGKYRLEKEIGKGAFGTVYRASHIETKALAAVKAIQLSGLNGRLLKQLERELNVMKKVKSPFVVELYEVFKTANCVYLAMEYCSGGDLENYTKTHTCVPEPQAKRWLGNLLDAFQVLQSENVLHRDLKLANILLSTADEGVSIAKVADFGFARFASETSLADTMLGTPLFMAPEILERTPYTYKVDVWSLGVIAYEIMVGRPAFIVYSMEELSAAQKRPLYFPEDCQISPEAKGLITEMMRYKPHERPDFSVVRKHPFFGEKMAGEEEKIAKIEEFKAKTDLKPEETKAEAEIAPIPEAKPVEAKAEAEIAPIPEAKPVETKAESPPIEPIPPTPPTETHEISHKPTSSQEFKDLINEYEVIEDRAEEESKIIEGFSVVEDSQFVTGKGKSEEEGKTTIDVPIVEERREGDEEKQANKEQNQTGMEEKEGQTEAKGEIIEEEAKGNAEEKPRQLSNREDIIRNELLRLDFKCTQELKSITTLADYYSSQKQYLLAFGIFLCVSRELQRAFSHFNALCQAQGIVREMAGEAEKVYERLQVAQIEVEGKLGETQVQLTCEDLTRSVMRYEDEGLRVEGRLLQVEAQRLHSTLPSLSPESQLSVLRQALSLLSIAASDPSCELTSNALMSEYSVQMTLLLGASLLSH